MLGVPLGVPVREEVSPEQDLRATPSRFLLSFCAAAWSNFFLKVSPQLTQEFCPGTQRRGVAVPVSEIECPHGLLCPRTVVSTFVGRWQYAMRLDNRCWECLCRILRVSSEVGVTSQQIASLTLSVGGLGLHSAVLVRHAAHWSSWADCVHMVNKRHPQICRSILMSIITDDPPHHIEGVTISEAALRLSGFHPPSWEELAEGLRPGNVSSKMRTQPRCCCWQKLTAESLELDFWENVLMPPFPVEKRALLKSQSGPFSSTPQVAFPTTTPTTPFPFIRPFATADVAVLSTALATTVQHAQVAGVLRRRGFPLESAAARAGRQAPVCERT